MVGVKKDTTIYKTTLRWHLFELRKKKEGCAEMPGEESSQACPGELASLDASLRCLCTSACSMRPTQEEEKSVCSYRAMTWS